MADRNKLFALQKKKHKQDMIKQGKLLMGKFATHRNWPIEMWEIVLRALPLSLVTTSGDASCGQKSKLMTLLLESNRMQTLSDTSVYRKKVSCWHGLLSEIIDEGVFFFHCYDLY
jgi:hypothetical protein